MSNDYRKIDIVIVGGGIAGLWTLNRLRQLGFTAILLESNTLGGGQTIKSQGIIHGGIKYALKGFLTKSANTIEEMPKRWKACLTGQGEIDLRSVKILSSDQLLWSTGGLTSEITGFFASKALKSRVQKLARTDYPFVLQNATFKGHVYKLEEVVLDAPSLIRTLAEPHKDFIYKIDSENGLKFYFDPKDKNHIAYLELYNNGKTLKLQALQIILTAGEGNEALSIPFKEASAMQRRPLQMVWFKFSEDYPLYAHCIDSGMNPRITITSHIAEDGKTVWYLGGQIAEEGIKRTKEEQILCAQQELKTLFPWLNFSNMEWGSFFINRAEPKEPGGKRPEKEFLQTFSNYMMAWPTKLALAPLLADDIIVSLQKHNINPIKSKTQEEILEYFKGWAQPKIAKSVWDEPVSTH